MIAYISWVDDSLLLVNLVLLLLGELTLAINRLNWRVQTHQLLLCLLCKSSVLLSLWLLSWLLTNSHLRRQHSLHYKSSLTFIVLTRYHLLLLVRLHVWLGLNYYLVLVLYSLCILVIHLLLLLLLIECVLSLCMSCRLHWLDLLRLLKWWWITLTWYLVIKAYILRAFNLVYAVIEAVDHILLLRNIVVIILGVIYNIKLWTFHDVYWLWCTSLQKIAPLLTHLSWMSIAWTVIHL